MLQTPQFLREHGLAALLENFALISSRHERFPQLVSLKYNQIASPMHERIAQECRGLIVDESREFAVVSHPFEKFFNAGEPLAAPIDWENARVFEKLDGSLMSLYAYDGAWQIASSGRPDAGGPLGTREGLTMAQGFWETFAAQGLKLPSESFFGWWFGWEMTTPWNQVVVRHDAPKLTLIGARDADGNERFPEEIAPIFGWPHVQSVELRDLESVLRAAEAIEAFAGEGFVVCDANFSRVKVKSSRYVALHLMRDSFSMRRLVEIVRSGEGGEFLAYFPEYAAREAKIRALYEELVAQIEADFARLNPIESPHEFARLAQETRLSSAVFALRNRKVASAREFLKSAHLPSVLKWLGLRDEVT